MYNKRRRPTPTRPQSLASQVVGGLFPVLLLLGAVVGLPLATAGADPFAGARSTSPAADAEIAATINRLRQEVYGLGPIEYRPFDEGVDSIYADCVLNTANDTSTFQPFDVNLVHFPASCGYDNPGVSENLAFGWGSNGTNLNAAVDQWNNSNSGHRGAMLSNAAIMRIRTLCVGETYFAVAFFEPATRNGNSPTSGTQVAVQPAGDSSFYTTTGYTCSGGQITAPDGSSASTPVAPATDTPKQPLDGGTTIDPAKPITSIVGMTGYEADVARAYKAMFGRMPDGPGFAYWAEERRSGLTMWSMTRAFSNSAEFKSTAASRWPAGMSNAEYVDKLYLNILERPADSTGAAYWIRQLDSGRSGRHLMMINFMRSDEFMDLTGTK